MPAKRNKKGPTKGTGGKGKRALEGKKPTLPKEQRHWYAKKQQSKSGSRTQQGPRVAASREETRATPSGTPGRDAGGSELLVGRNPVIEALRAGVPATTLFLSTSIESEPRTTEATRLAGEAGVRIREASKAELDRRCESSGQPGAVHQGVVLKVPAYDYWDTDRLLETARASDTPPLLVALDSVTDPHNLGAVARSAAAFGAHGIVLPERRSAGVTTGAWKTSAGALARLPVAQATNLTRTLERYKRDGLFVAGLAADGDTTVADLDLASEPLVVVIGSEGKGLSRLVRETCDTVASIPISGAESLNASVAAGISLYEVARRRRASAR
ncbi:23S rRNA (guanosine(2251)-2'-O)-methyltransferase RlmB [Halostreptopolyspora alba]|uniref:23S rRNA (Guanosine(2251)-2'-O)-methyltransferase RlmB n=1 Tax=Halostreptopolyspora alba TaxID=2487137 RepID=A0A3N0E8A5_9ACTN|nr:23S rRNA (guanosine(2251)-2'-O)-methyltransferase RlmB [Nocardiopsaceae bacterium YIM 96095]